MLKVEKVESCIVEDSPAELQEASWTDLRNAAPVAAPRDILPIRLDARSDEELLQMQFAYASMFEVHPRDIPWESALEEILDYRFNQACQGQSLLDCRFNVHEDGFREIFREVLRGTIEELQDPNLQWEAVEYLRREPGITLEEVQDQLVLRNKIISERSRLTGAPKGSPQSFELPWPQDEYDKIKLAKMLLVGELLGGNELRIQPSRGQFGGLDMSRDLDMHLDSPHIRDSRGRVLSPQEIIDRHGESGLYLHLHIYREQEGIQTPWKLYYDCNDLLIVHEGDPVKGQKYTVEKLREGENNVFVLKTYTDSVDQ
jgi:hypothetical protein